MIETQERTRIALVLGATGGIGSAVARGLAKRGWQVRALNRNAEKAARAAGAVPGVASAGARGDLIEVLATDAGRVLPRVPEATERAGAQVRGVELVQPNLEAVFLHLTGRALRDTD